MTAHPPPAAEPEERFAPLRNTRQLLGRLVRNRRSVARDLGLVARNARTIPWIVFPLRSERDVRPEFAPESYQSRWEYISVVGQMVLPVQRESASQGTRVVMPPNYVWPPAARTRNGSS